MTPSKHTYTHLNPWCTPALQVRPLYVVLLSHTPPTPDGLLARLSSHARPINNVSMDGRVRWPKGKTSRHGAQRRGLALSYWMTNGPFRQIQRVAVNLHHRPGEVSVLKALYAVSTGSTRWAITILNTETDSTCLHATIMMQHWKDQPLLTTLAIK